MQYKHRCGAYMVAARGRNGLRRLRPVRYRVGNRWWVHRATGPVRTRVGARYGYLA